MKGSAGFSCWCLLALCVLVGAQKSTKSKSRILNDIICKSAKSSKKKEEFQFHWFIKLDLLLNTVIIGIIIQKLFFSSFLFYD